MSRLTFWFEFASTYSYLAASRIQTLATEAGVDLIWRPFLLGPIFQSQGWNTSPFNLFRAKGMNMWRDMERQAAKYGLPAIVRPEGFPQNSLLAARIATIGSDQPWGPDFTRSVFMAQFAGGRMISDEKLLIEILRDLGQSGADLVAQAKSDQVVKDQLRQTTEDALALGIYGAPSFTTEDGELFWGNDRLEDAVAWAKSP